MRIISVFSLSDQKRKSKICGSYLFSRYLTKTEKYLKYADHICFLDISAKTEKYLKYADHNCFLDTSPKSIQIITLARYTAQNGKVKYADHICFLAIWPKTEK